MDNEMTNSQGSMLFVALALIAVSLGVSIYVMVFLLTGAGIEQYMFKALTMAMFIATAVYALFLYKIPHGNHMKYLILVFAIYLSLFFIVEMRAGMLNTAMVCCMLGMIIGATYMSGRLYKIKQNKIIIVLVEILAIINDLCLLKFAGENIAGIFSCFSRTILWFCISLAYITRYKMHKVAGMYDKEKNEDKEDISIEITDKESE